MRGLICTCLIFVLGCTSHSVSSAATTISAPRLRPSPYFGSISGLSYSDIDDIGRHDYDSFFGENNSLIYTAKAGYIDLGHLRESADRTRYLYEVCYANIKSGRTDFSYEIIEPAQYQVLLQYPDNWQSLSETEKDRIAREVAIDLGQHFAHMSTVWHEIITWYGYSSLGLMSEKASSFSWEDGYSDLMGTKIAAMVLRNNTSYNEGMTKAVVEEIKKLDPQSAETAKKATNLIKGEWFSGRYPFLSMKRRNFDVGFDDGYITPFRVPGISDGVAEERCKVPTLDSLSRYGFTMRLLLTPRGSERKDVLAIVDRKGKQQTLEPKLDFPRIIEHIRNEAIDDKGQTVVKATL